MQQLELIFNSAPQPAQPDGWEWLSVGGRKIRLVLARHRRARRYVLRLRADGAARVTIPRGGSVGVRQRG